MPTGPFRESVGVTIDTSEVGPYLESKTNAIREALRQRMIAVDLMLQAKVVGEKLSGNPINRRTGKLSDSVRTLDVTVTDESIDGGITAGGGVAPYAPALEYGSAPHDIVPTTKQALMFMIDGKQVFAKLVHHPGTRAYAFMRGTLDENADNIIGEFQDAAAEAAGS